MQCEHVNLPVCVYVMHHLHYIQNCIATMSRTVHYARLASQWLIANQPYMAYHYRWWSWGRIISVGSECGLDGGGDGFSGGSNISVRRLNRRFVVCKNQNGRAENHSELIWLPNSELACFQGLNSCCISKTMHFQDYYLWYVLTESSVLCYTEHLLGMFARHFYSVYLLFTQLPS